MKINNQTANNINFNGQIQFYLQKAGLENIKELPSVHVCQIGDDVFVKTANKLMSKHNTKINLVPYKKSDRCKLSFEIVDKEALSKYISQLSKSRWFSYNAYIQKTLSNDDVSAITFTLSKMEFDYLKFSGGKIRIPNYFKLKKFENKVRTVITLKDKKQVKLLNNFFSADNK